MYIRYTILITWIGLSMLFRLSFFCFSVFFAQQTAASSECAFENKHKTALGVLHKYLWMQKEQQQIHFVCMLCIHTANTYVSAVKEAYMQCAERECGNDLCSVIERGECVCVRECRVCMFKEGLSPGIGHWREICKVERVAPQKINNRHGSLLGFVRFLKTFCSTYFCVYTQQAVTHN